MESKKTDEVLRQKLVLKNTDINALTDQIEHAIAEKVEGLFLEELQKEHSVSPQELEAKFLENFQYEVDEKELNVDYTVKLSNKHSFPVRTYLEISLKDLSLKMKSLYGDSIYVNYIANDTPGKFDTFKDFVASLNNQKTASFTFNVTIRNNFLNKMMTKSLETNKDLPTNQLGTSFERFFKMEQFIQKYQASKNEVLEQYATRYSKIKAQFFKITTESIDEIIAGEILKDQSHFGSNSKTSILGTTGNSRQRAFHLIKMDKETAAEAQSTDLFKRLHQNFSAEYKIPENEFSTTCKLFDFEPRFLAKYNTEAVNDTKFSQNKSFLKFKKMMNLFMPNHQYYILETNLWLSEKFKKKYIKEKEINVEQSYITKNIEQDNLNLPKASSKIKTL